MNATHHDHNETCIEERFNGPPGYGNGGIVCALIAEQCGASFEAELRLPAPLERPLTIDRDAAGEVELRDGDALVACGRTAEIDLDVPAAPTWDAAERARDIALGEPHPFAACFVCGPERLDGDGLRVIAGPVAGRDGLYAAPWIPHANLADEDGKAVATRFAWAALDCPGGIAAIAGRGVPMLLARFKGHLERGPHVGERCIVIGWVIEHAGRKHRAGTALFDADGEVIGRAESLWIEPRPGTSPI